MASQFSNYLKQLSHNIKVTSYHVCVLLLASKRILGVIVPENEVVYIIATYLDPVTLSQFYRIAWRDQGYSPQLCLSNFDEIWISTRSHIRVCQCAESVQNQNPFVTKIMG